MEAGNFSGLRNGNWKFYGFHSVKRKLFRFTQQISESFHFQNGNFFRKNGNPSHHGTGSLTHFYPGTVQFHCAINV